MKILLLGKNGQVGTELQRTLLPLGEVLAFGRKEVDLQNLSELSTLLDARRPDIIVNAAAYTAVDKAETNETAAFKVNAHAVEIMADYAQDKNVLLLHYSTDYVFDGEKSSPYVEADETNPQSVYGRSKRAGEVAICKSGCNFLVFRTSWVFSAHGSNFIKTILKLAKERESLNVISEQYGAPTSAELIADVSALAIAGYCNHHLTKGIYHLTAAGETNWQVFACHIIHRALDNGVLLKLSTEKIYPISTEAHPLPAKRPKNSRLDTSTLSSALGLTLPNWKIHANRTIDQLTQRDLFT